jgi:membrane protein insertase Oxa1/YidC/SpoIIIJ
MGLFTQFVYQPFFNLLVAIYLGLDVITGGNADMGVAVIIFTVALRIILLPLSIASGRTESERREIEESFADIKKTYASDPVRQKSETKKLLRGNRRTLISEGVNLTIQVAIALMLYRIFAKGLLGADFNLIYNFMPPIPESFNLIFLGRYDLTRPNVFLNFIQSLSIFLVEVLSVFTSPFPINRREVIRLQVILPLTSFIIFAYLPAGKKLFIITTLSFSIVLILARQGLSLVKKLQKKIDTIGMSKPNQVTESQKEENSKTAESQKEKQEIDEKK